MNKRILRKHQKYLYKNIINKINQNSNNIKFNLLYKQKTNYHDAYIWLSGIEKDNNFIRNFVAYEIIFTNESITYSIQESNLNKYIQNDMEQIVNYFTNKNKSWKIGNDLILY